MQSLPTYKSAKQQHPLSRNHASFIDQSRKIIRNILNGVDSRLLLIVGPCSIHDPDSSKEYASRLRDLSVEVSSHFFLVMRGYFEKPRTKSGWKGFLYDPFLNGSDDILAGISLTRQLLKEFADLRVPVATEFLDPLTAYYYDDLISWGSIGARTSTSQPHRQLASALAMPIGIKNDINGNVHSAINGVLAASHPQTYVRMGDEGGILKTRTKGNMDTHIVLRGGENNPNYDAYSIREALGHLNRSGLPLRLIVDCSHHNSNKRFDNQPAIFRSVFRQCAEGNSAIKGMMLESHLRAGNQSLNDRSMGLAYGVSITDGCLDWGSTQDLILEAVGELVQDCAQDERMAKLSCIEST